jgi:hypothetical protein
MPQGIRGVILLYLAPDQVRTAREGYVHLSEQQALSIRGQITAAFGAGRKPGTALRCACGCGMTLARAMKRHPSKARPEDKS